MCDEESRRKYDLKRAYRSQRKDQSAPQEENRNRSGRRSNRTQGYRRKETKKSAEEQRRDRITSYFFGGALLLFVAMMVVMISIGPSQNEDEEKIKALIAKSALEGPSFKDIPAIYNADSPYDSVFGGSWILEENHNSVIVVNTKEAAVVVCLQEKNSPFRTIRNEYLEPGMSYRINGIPKGTYFLKAYFGRDWDPKKSMNAGKVKGGFKEEMGFFKSDAPENLIVIDHKNAGEHLYYSTYEVYLSTLFGKSDRSIPETVFFK